MGHPIEISFKFFDEERVARFWKSEYANNGNTYIGIVVWNEDDNSWVIWDDLTINFPDMKCEKNKAFLYKNNCSHEIVATLIDKGYIKEAGVAHRSGFYTCPLVEFSEEFLDGLFQEE